MPDSAAVEDIKNFQHNDGGPVDEKHRRNSASDSAAGTHEELMAVRTQSWGKNGLIYMWIGYVVPFKSRS